jgi:hypothetical protein
MPWRDEAVDFSAQQYIGKRRERAS